MILTNFEESNCVLGKPADMTDDQCEAACAFRGVTTDDMPVVITCWKLTEKELEEITKTKRCWLMIYGHTMPPAYIGTEKLV